MIVELLAFMGAYLVGSIPTGYVIARIAGINDIRSHGSGTIGATNVARVLGKKYFFMIFLLDAGKAFGYLWAITAQAHMQLLAGCAIALVLGNTRSLFLTFTGGKGVATLAGIIGYICPWVLALFFMLWLIVLRVTHIVGLASVGALASTPFLLYWCDTIDARMYCVLLLLSFWCIYLHRQHIAPYLYR